MNMTSSETTSRAATMAAPRPTVVQVHCDDPIRLNVSASGGSSADVFAAIVQALATAGQIGPQALTDAGNALLDAGQDMALAAAWDAAQVTAQGRSCPACGSNNVNIYDIEGARSYACRDCGETWR